MVEKTRRRSICPKNKDSMALSEPQMKALAMEVAEEARKSSMAEAHDAAYQEALPILKHLLHQVCGGDLGVWRALESRFEAEAAGDVPVETSSKVEVMGVAALPVEQCRSTARLLEVADERLANPEDPEGNDNNEGAKEKKTSITTKKKVATKAMSLFKKKKKKNSSDPNKHGSIAVMDSMLMTACLSADTEPSNNKYAALRVHILEGESIVPPKSHGRLCNPYCRTFLVDRTLDALKNVVVVEQGAVTTKTRLNTSTPNWDETFTLELMNVHSEALVVDVYDQAARDGTQVPGSVDAFIGRIIAPLEQLLQGVSFEKEGLTGCHQWFPLYDATHTTRVCGHLNLRLALDETDTEGHPGGPAGPSQETREQLLRDAIAPQISSQQISIFCGTWNVGNAAPSEDVAWVPPGVHDLYVIGCQECKYDCSSTAIGDDCKEHWRSTFLRHFGSSYRLLCFKSLWEIRALVMVRSNLYHHISGLLVHKETTGVGNVLGNKGGVCLSFFWDQTPLTFAVAHLAAHQSESHERNNNARNILKNSKVATCARVSTDYSCYTPDVCTSSHHLFFMGDLNYRVDYGGAEEHKSPPPEIFEKIVALVGDVPGRRTLLATDQLEAMRGQGKVFYHFEEDKDRLASFSPTFKVQRRAGVQYLDQRSPAWCDRILHKSLPGTKYYLKQTSYDSAEHVDTSDHKPVFATFNLTTLSLPLATDRNRGQLHISLLHLRCKELTSVAHRRLDNSKHKKGGAQKLGTTFHAMNVKMKTQLNMASGSKHYFPCFIEFSAPFFQEPLRTDINNVHEWEQAQTQNFTGQEGVDTMNGKPSITLTMNNLARLALEFIFVRVLDSDNNAVADGVIPMMVFDELVDAHDGSTVKQLEKAISIELNYAGTAAGTFEGKIKLAWC